MKRVLLVLSIFSLIRVVAQDELHCGTDQIMKRLYEMHPELKAKKAALDAASQANLRSGGPTSYTIPIVFHILHLGGPENISDAQVIDAVRILNDDYGHRNADTSQIIPSFQNIADSTGIHFVLATKDPSGNCTSGIVHYYDPDTDWNDLSPTLYSHTWDPTRYLNVYVVRTITMSSGFSAAGYTYFPGTFSPGDPYDAIVVLNNYFGSIGTGSPFQSRVLTHEVGHWLDLYHVFGMNSAGVDCSGDDLVGDTPTTPGYLICPNPSIPSTYQICNAGVDENFQNYMDYSYCNRMFTHGQAQRMQAALNNNISGRDNLWTNANLISTGVINPVSPCTPVADFTYDRSTTCAGIPVTFHDASWNGTATSYNWSFPGGTPSTSTSISPVVTYATPGVYSVTYSSSNSAGNSTPVTQNSIITVVSATATYQGNWSEGFEINALPNADWTVQSSSGGAYWIQSFDASYSGTASAELPLTNNTRNSVTSMTSPSVNLSNLIAPNLTFKVATAESNPNHVNKLEVYITTDCGQTWTSLYSRTGPALITSSTNVSPFIPMGLGEWRSESISLSSYATASAAQFKFEYTRDTIPSPNNIFIDNVNVQGSNGIAEGNVENTFEVYPNPSSGSMQVSFSIPEKHGAEISVTDMLGRRLETVSCGQLSAGPHVFAIGAAKKFDAGIYLLTVDVDGMRVTKKVVVK